MDNVTGPLRVVVVVVVVAIKREQEQDEMISGDIRRDACRQRGCSLIGIGCKTAFWFVAFGIHGIGPKLSFVNQCRQIPLGGNAKEKRSYGSADHTAIV
jgi:hypothetical protein